MYRLISGETTVQAAQALAANSLLGRFSPSYGMVINSCGMDALSVGHIQRT